MKILYILCLFSLVLVTGNAIAQTTNSLYLYSSTVSGGQITFVEYPGSKISLHKFEQYIDTSENHRGDHITTFSFVQSGLSMKRTINLKFDKPVTSCEFKFLKSKSPVKFTSNKVKTEYQFVFTQIGSNEFSFVISSKEKVFTKIEEVSRYIHQ